MRALGILIAGLLVGALVPSARAGAHGDGVADLQDTYIKGVFSPTFTPPAAGSYELPVIKRVAPFVLRDTTGRAVNTRGVMHGKVSVVSFIYTACADRLGCPLASLALRELQGLLLAEGLTERVVLLSISVDPERDTPAELARYARRYDPHPTLWRFLTPPSERASRPLLASYGQDRTPIYGEDGRFTGQYRHVLKVFLIDGEGHVRNIYSTGFLVAQILVNDIKTLLAAAKGRPVPAG